MANPQIEALRTSLDKYLGYLKSDPGNVDLVSQVADLQYQLGDFDDARQLLQQTLAKGAQHPGLMYRLSNIAIATGHPDEAIEILRGLQSQGVDNASIQYNLAYAYMFEKDYEQARQQLERIIAANDTTVPTTPVLLGRCYHHLGELEKAIELGRQYIDQHPQDQEALGVFALAAFDEGNNEDAKRWAQQAVEINDANLEARVALGSLKLAEQEYEAAGKDFQAALKGNPQSGRAWSGQGLVDMLSLDMDTAIASLQKAVQYMPNHIGTWHALAWCQIMKNDLAGAKQSFDKSMDIDHSFNETHGGLAVVAYLQGDKQTAKTEARKAVLLDSQSFSGRFAESLLMQDTDPAEAQKMVSNILQSQIDGKSLQETVIKSMRKRVSKKKLH